MQLLVAGNKIQRNSTHMLLCPGVSVCVIGLTVHKKNLACKGLNEVTVVLCGGIVSVG